MKMSHVVGARIMETMGKKREKYEMLSEYVPLFDWSNQVTCFAPKFKHGRSLIVVV